MDTEEKLRIAIEALQKIRYEYEEERGLAYYTAEEALDLIEEKEK